MMRKLLLILFAVTFLLAGCSNTIYTTDVINTILSTNTAQSHLEQGISYIKQELLQEAITELTKAIELNPSLAEAYARRSYAYCALYEYIAETIYYDTVVTDCTMAIKLDPTNASYYFNRSYIYDEGCEYEKEMIDITTAINLDHSEAYYYTIRGRLYLEQYSDYNNAIADFSKYIQFNPDFASGYADRAEVYMIMEDYESAIEDYTNAIELSPDPTSYSPFNWIVSSYYDQRGLAYSKLGNKEKALDDYNNSERIHNYQYEN